MVGTTWKLTPGIYTTNIPVEKYEDTRLAHAVQIHWCEKMEERDKSGGGGGGHL